MRRPKNIIYKAVSLFLAVATVTALSACTRENVPDRNDVSETAEMTVYEDSSVTQYPDSTETDTDAYGDGVAEEEDIMIGYVKQLAAWYDEMFATRFGLSEEEWGALYDETVGRFVNAYGYALFMQKFWEMSNGLAGLQEPSGGYKETFSAEDDRTLLERIDLYIDYASAGITDEEYLDTVMDEVIQKTREQHFEDGFAEIFTPKDLVVHLVIADCNGKVIADKYISKDSLTENMG